MRSRILAVLLLLAVAGCSTDRPAPVSVPAAVPSGPLRVLHEWDAARAAAWEQGDPVALAGLYVPGARAGAQDVALLRRYRARGVRLVGLRMQLLSVRVLIKREAQLRLVVVERFAGARAVSDDRARDLPVGVPVRRMIDLRRTEDRWLVAAVRSLPREGPR